MKNQFPMKKFTFITLVLLITPFVLSGCVQVQPWEREHLAKDIMLPAPYPLDVSFKEHGHFSREGTTGGMSPDAGGCGCN